MASIYGVGDQAQGRLRTLVMLCDMTDIFGDVPLPGQRAGIAEPLLGELAAQMLEQPQPDEDHDEPALASGGTIQSDLDQGRAGALAGKTTR